MAFRKSKVADLLTVGATVTITTTYGGTHTGEIIAVKSLGPLAPDTARLVRFRYWDGTESVYMRTDTRYTGYLHTHTPKQPNSTKGETMARNSSEVTGVIIDRTARGDGTRYAYLQYGESGNYTPTVVLPATVRTDADVAALYGVPLDRVRGVNDN